MWICFRPIAIINGIIREIAYKQFVGALLAHHISTLIAIVTFISLTYVLLHKQLNKISLSTALLIGLLWMSMTMAFEFTFGYFLDHKSLVSLVADYDITRGRVWILFLLSMFFTPVSIRFIERKKVNKYEK